MQEEIENLKQEFFENEEIKITLSHEEGDFLLRLIAAGNALKERRNTPIKWLIYKYNKWKWSRLFQRSFDDFVKANEIFRFYMLFRGNKALTVYYHRSEKESQFKIVKKGKPQLRVVERVNSDN